MSESRTIRPAEIGRHPALRHLESQLGAAQLGATLASHGGAEVTEFVPGTGVIQIHFGPFVSHHGRRYTLTLDQSGKPLHLWKVEGGLQSAPISKVSLPSGEVRRLMKDLFGPYSLRRTWLTARARDARSYWDSLRPYDLTDAEGNGRPDDAITNADICAVARIRTLAGQPTTPEQVKREIDLIRARHRSSRRQREGGF